ncbi:MAG: alginate lyase family protein [Ferruginibacter sp.]
MVNNILRRLPLIYRTLSYLKYSQLFYQIKYRVLSKKRLSSYLKNSDRPVSLHGISFTLPPGKTQLVHLHNTFNFLHLNVEFEEAINWNFQDNGKLWNYNLQYFNYLGQNDIANTVKENWLIDIGNWLNDGRLKLEPYPVSLRVMNTIRFLSVDSINNTTIIENVFAQLQYLNKHLEYHILGNHLLENAFALLMGGHAFRKEEWDKKAKDILYLELKEQVLNDGAHFELSPMYHQVILFRVLELADWYSRLQHPDKAFLNFVKDKARQMLGWLQAITFKNGDIPHFNDSAIEIALTSNELFRMGALLKLEPLENCSLSKSGYRKYMLGDYECVVDVAEPGPSYQPGHSHADALSFVLYKSAKPFIVDIGTSTYQPGQRRNYERSTSAHNTVVVNDQNQSEVWGGFRLGWRASVKIINEDAVQLEAEHNGYYKAFGVYHKRKFHFSDNSIEIADHIGNASGKLLFHFHPDCEVLLTEDAYVVLIKEKGFIKFENASRLSLKEYEFAEGFNKYREAFKVEVDFKSELKATINFL